MRIESKHDCRGDKCPFCLQVHVNFAVVSDDLLGCLKCGCVFIRKSVKEDLRDRQVEILVEQLKEKEVPKDPFHDDFDPSEKLYCECGFFAKNTTGLAAHKRHCKVLMEKEYER